MTADGMRLGESEQMLNMPQTDDRDRGINVGRERVRKREEMKRWRNAKQSVNERKQENYRQIK